MSIKKKFLGIILILLTFLSVFVFSLFPSFFSDNPAGRFEKEIKMEHGFLKNETKPIVMIFFGYVGCSDICIPALEELSKIYDAQNKSKVAFYFVNLQYRSHPEMVDHYAKNFNKDFNGVYLNRNEILAMVSKLRFVYIPSTIDKNIIDHSGYLHLFIKKDGEYIQKYIYTTRPFNIEFIINDIKKLQKELK